MNKVTISLIWVTIVLVATLFGIVNGLSAQVTAAVIDGAKTAVELGVVIAGPLCLWSGAAALMDRVGITGALARLLSPLLGRLFPAMKQDSALGAALSGNVCANLLGLGNAATPLGIQAVQRLKDPRRPELATDAMCRLVVMNTASIQLLPTTVAAIRLSAGAKAPFDLLPCVWVSSLLSVTAGLLATRFFAKRWSDG